MVVGNIGGFISSINSVSSPDSLDHFSHWHRLWFNLDLAASAELETAINDAGTIAHHISLELVIDGLSMVADLS